MATSNKPVPLSSVVAKIAEKRGIETVKAGKLVRGYLRRHDEELREEFAYPPEEKGKADGNRYPAMPRKAAAHLLKVLS